MSCLRRESHTSAPDLSLTHLKSYFSRLASGLSAISAHGTKMCVYMYSMLAQAHLHRARAFITAVTEHVYVSRVGIDRMSLVLHVGMDQ